MASASGDNTAVIWSVSAWKAKFRLKHNGPVYTAVFSPDGRSLATASGDGRVAIWSVSDGQKRLDVKKHDDAVYGAAFSPNGRILATAGGNGDGGDTTCRLWDSGTLTLVTEYQGHTFPVYGVAFSPDGTRLAAVGDDFRLRVWSTRGFYSLLQKKLSREAIYAVTFLSDGKSVAVGGADTMIRLLPYPTAGQTRSADGAHAQ